jgi:hypothetical protein
MQVFFLKKLLKIFLVLLKANFTCYTIRDKVKKEGYFFMFGKLLKKLGFNLEEASWIMYDIGNSAQTLTMCTVIFPLLIARITPGDSSVLLGYANGIYAFILAILSPVLGTMADYKDTKMKFFKFFLALGIIAGFALALPFVDYRWALGLFVLAMIGYNGSLIFYDAFIVDVCDDERVDEVSAAGYAWGYIASTFAFLIFVIPFALVGCRIQRFKIRLNLSYFHPYPPKDLKENPVFQFRLRTKPLLFPSPRSQPLKRRALMQKTILQLHFSSLAKILRIHTQTRCTVLKLHRKQYGSQENICHSHIPLFRLEHESRIYTKNDEEPPLSSLVVKQIAHRSGFGSGLCPESPQWFLLPFRRWPQYQLHEAQCPPIRYIGGKIPAPLHQTDLRFLWRGSTALHGDPPQWRC